MQRGTGLLMGTNISKIYHSTYRRKHLNQFVLTLLCELLLSLAPV